MSTAEVRGSCSKVGEVKILEVEVEVEGIVGSFCCGGWWVGGIESVVCWGGDDSNGAWIGGMGIFCREEVAGGR